MADPISGYDDLDAREREALLRALLALPGVLVGRYDREHNLEFLNPALLEEIRVIRMADDDEPVPEARPEALKARFRSIVAAVVASGEPARHELRYHTLEGWRHVEAQFIPEIDHTGTVSHVLVVGRNIAAEREAQDELRETQQLAHVGSWSWDVASGEFHATDEYCRIVGLDPSAACDPEAVLARTHPDDQPLVRDVLVRVRDLHEAVDVEFRLVGPEGERTLHSVAEPVLDDADRVIGMRGVLRDVTELRDREREQRGHAAQVRALLDSSPDPISRYDRDLRVVAANRATLALAGLPEAAVLGHTNAEIGYPPEEVEFRDHELRVVFETGEPRTHDHETRTQDGSVLWFESTAVPEFDAEGTVTHAVLASRDITNRKHAEIDLARRAMEDGLTRLANRAGLLGELERSLRRRARTNRPVALMMLDLDHFKLVNDSLGHAVGDRLLVDIAGRLRAAVRPTDTLARLGGDEFVVLLEDLGEAIEPARVADRILDTLRHPIELDHHELTTTASIGIAVADVEGVNSGTLLDQADAAMYAAKEAGRDRYEFFGEELSQRVDERVALERALRTALSRDELRVLYQPEVDLVTGRIRAAEAFLRWIHPDRGLLEAKRFIAVAEETGQICQIGAWVLDRVCEQAARWHNDHHRIAVRVNLSPVQLADRDFPELVRATLSRYGLGSEKVSFDIVEATALASAPMVRQNLHTLEREIGVRFALDDFGTGYSSIASLRDLPTRALKIDRSLVARINHDAGEHAVVAALTALARELGLEVIAEGVEQPEQAQALRDLGVHAAQGILFSPPVDANLVSHLLEAGTPFTTGVVPALGASR